MDWRIELTPRGGPRYLQIVAAIERAVGAGRLRPGDRLPAQRELAQALGLDLTTVTRAYRACKQRGLIDARGPLGSFVAPPKVELSQVVDLSMNLPPQPAGFDIPERLRRGLSQVLARSDAATLMTYHLGGGSGADREAARRWLAPTLGEVDPERIVVCPGAQAALAALILCGSRPGDTILCEPLAYPGLLLVAAQLDRRVAAVESDAAGMLPEALQRRLRAAPARLLYLNPTAQNPSARSMPLARRREIARIVRRHGLLVMEDEPYRLLSEQPAPEPLSALAPEHACHIATLSKCLTPGLRTAFALLPPPFERERFLAALRAINLMASPLTSALATQWLLDGSAGELLHKVQAESRARREIARAIFAGSDAATCDGVHLWHELPAYWTAEAFGQAARREGLTIAAADAFVAPGAAPRNAIRISLGSAHGRAELQSALRRLERLINGREARPNVLV